jgi:hypothetical protein
LVSVSTISEAFVDEAQIVAEVAKEIESYLAVHRGAADGIRGIIEWWLRDLPFAPNPEHVALALAALRWRGIVRCELLADGSELWSRSDG